MNQSVADAKPRDEWLEFWERRETPFLEAMPYVLLVFATGLDIAVRGGLGAETRIDLALALASAAWMAWMVSLHREWIERTRLMQVFFAGLVGLMAAMVVRAPIFGFYTFTGYVWAVLVLRGRQRLLGVAAVAAISAISQTGGVPALTASALCLFAVIWLINFGVAGGVIWFGWVGNEQKRRRQQAIAELTEANRRLEETLRENAALHEQLLVQAREAGVAEERQRLAGEIHDTLAQGLTGIITQLQAAEQPGGGRQRHTEAAIALARGSLSEARRSVRALRPEALEDARLPEALRDVGRRWSELHGVEVGLTVTGRARVLRPEIEVALLRTAQEALANVAKHAHATRVGMTLSYMEDLVTLDVRDDGVGFTGTAGGTNGGYGLTAMRQRIEGVAGTLEIESDERAGTAISACVPALAGKVGA